MSDEIGSRYDVVVVGGGAAGLSAALTLGRARRSVLVIDAGEPRNAPADGVHGFLSREGVKPAELVEIGRGEARGYGVHIVDGRAVSATKADGGFTVGLEDGRSVACRRLLVTTGLVDELPDVEGVRERWGHDVLHCPYCHGWEVRDQAIGVLVTSPFSLHQALLFRQWTSNLTLLLHTHPALDDAGAERLAALDIRVVTGEVEAVQVEGDRITGVRLQGGTIVPLQALVVAPRFVARSEVLTTLGLEAVPHPRGFGDHIPVDEMSVTAVPGVYAAGNVTDLGANVVVSAAQGSTAAAFLNLDLINEDAQRAVDARRALA